MKPTNVLSKSGHVVLDPTGRFGVIVKKKVGTCTWCGTQVKRPRILWCSQGCVGAYEATQPGTLRRLVYQRDEGICASCGVDCDALTCQLRVDPSKVVPQPNWPQWGLAFLLAHKTTVWQMDHRHPLHLGGEPFNLDNLVTLCCVCHSVKSRLEATNRKKK